LFLAKAKSSTLDERDLNFDEDVDVIDRVTAYATVGVFAKWGKKNAKRRLHDKGWNYTVGELRHPSIFFGASRVLSV
jgi:hypothetical protein